MLERRPDAARLNAVDEGAAHPAGDERILGEVLEVPAAQGGSLDVDARTQDHGNVFDRGFGPDGPPHALREFGIETGPEADGGREAGGGDAVVDAEVISRPGLLPQTVRAVGQHHRRNAYALNGFGVPEVGATGE